MVAGESSRTEEANRARPPVSTEAISPSSPPELVDAYSLLVDEATEYAVFALSPDGLVSTWNTGAAKIKGYGSEQIVGKHVSVFYTPEDREAGLPDRLLAEASMHGRVRAEGWRLRSDGSRFWASIVLTAVWDGGGALRGFTKLTRDDSDRRSAQQLLDEMGRLAEAERIAAELGATVIGRLDGIGLHLSAAFELERDPRVRSRLSDAIEEADQAIRELRRVVLENRPDSLGD